MLASENRWSDVRSNVQSLHQIWLDFEPVDPASVEPASMRHMEGAQAELETVSMRQDQTATILAAHEVGNTAMDLYQLFHPTIPGAIQRLEEHEARALMDASLERPKSADEVLDGADSIWHYFKPALIDHGGEDLALEFPGEPRPSARLPGLTRVQGLQTCDRVVTRDPVPDRSPLRLGGTTRQGKAGSRIMRNLKLVSSPPPLAKAGPGTPEAAEHRNGKTLHRILFTSDLSRASKEALEYAADVARKTGSSLTGIHAFNVPRILPSDPGSSHGILAELNREYSAQVEKFFLDPKLDGLDFEVRRAIHPEGAIGDLILELNADVTIVARHLQSSVEAFFLGADAERILRLAERPIWVVPQGGTRRTDWNPIVCAVDFSNPSKEALAFAIRFARDYASPLVVVHVTDIEDAEVEGGENRAPSIGRILETAKARTELLVRRYGAPHGTESLLLTGSPSAKILDTVERVSSDLLVMGLHGDRVRGSEGLGHTASQILRTADFPMILCPSA